MLVGYVFKEETRDLTRWILCWRSELFLLPKHCHYLLTVLKCHVEEDCLNTCLCLCLCLCLCSWTSGYWKFSSTGMLIGKINFVVLAKGLEWPRGLRHRSAAARLLRSWVRIPPGACVFFVSVMCCQLEVCATSWSHVQRSPTDCGTSLCVI